MRKPGSSAQPAGSSDNNTYMIVAKTKGLKHKKADGESFTFEGEAADVYMIHI